MDTNNMHMINIAIGKSRKSDIWINTEHSWEWLKKKLATPIRLKQSTVDFHNLTKEEQNLVKDQGGFVGGYCTNGLRKKASIRDRSLLTLDLDFCEKDIAVKYEAFSFKTIIYSTCSHKQNKPRHRIIVPCLQNLSTEEYSYIVRKFTEKFCFTDNVDSTSFDINRLMYWPTCPEDGEYFFKVVEGDYFDAKSLLDEDWKNMSTWNVGSREQKKIDYLIQKKQQDPKAKSSIIGAFCKEYDIRKCIETFLADKYIECGERYTWIEGEGTGGLILYDDDQFCFSHHGTDPISGILCNSLDLIRYHKFNGDLKETVKWAAQQDGINSWLAQEQFKDAFEDWMGKLEYDTKGKLNCTMKNFRIILENEFNLKYNEFEDVVMYNGHRYKNINDSEIIEHIENKFNVYSVEKLKRTINLVAYSNRFHPIKAYLESLKWDGKKRVETLILDYFKTDYNEKYVKAVTVKFLSAAIQRIYNPGCMYQYILVLKGQQQGEGKSTFYKKLFKDWFTDDFNVHDMKDKTAAEKLLGNWCIEIAEMAGVYSMDLEKVKAFITRQCDSYRPAYAEKAEKFPRQGIIVGTTNLNYLRDESGNRRFWTVEVFGRNTDDLETDQIWAEVMECYQNESLYLDRELEKIAKQIERINLDVDDRVALVEEYLEKPILPEDLWKEKNIMERKKFLDKDDITAEDAFSAETVKREYISAIEVWTECFNKNIADFNNKDSRLINNMLTSLGWINKNKPLDRISLGKVYGRQRVKFRPLES